MRRGTTARLHHLVSLNNHSLARQSVRRSLAFPNAPLTSAVSHTKSFVCRAANTYDNVLEVVVADRRGDVFESDEKLTSIG